MSEELFRLVYYSRNQILLEGDEFVSEVRMILTASQRNNAQAGVTGALLFNAGCFGQVLEGTRRAVEATFERIQRDLRHGEVSLLAFEPVKARTFPNWSMGFVGASLSERYGAFAEESGFDPSRMNADVLLSTLHRLALEEEHDAAA